MNEKPLRAAVVIPVFNRGELLRRVLLGLSEQTMSADEFEVLVCDDGSDENLSGVTDDFAKSLPHLRLLRQVNSGPATARNLGIREANADVVIFLDSDVVVGSSVIEDLLGALDDHPDWQGAEAKLMAIDGRDSPAWDAPHSENGGHYHTAGIAYRRDVLFGIGGFDENFSLAACEDVELATRVLALGTIGFVPSALIEHPRRRRSVASCWRARNNWRYVKILACRYGFLSWPENSTSYPRLRTAMAATLTLPSGRMRSAVSALFRSPGEGLRGIGLSVVDWLGGVAMLPQILFAAVPERRSSVLRAAPSPSRS